MRRSAACLAALAVASPVYGQQVQPCTWQASAQAIAEPWEENTTTFSGGRVRVAVIDTVEPAAGFAWLLVLSPPYDTAGARQCRVIGLQGEMGFAGIYFDTLTSAYDPATGLSLSVEVRKLDAATGGFDRGTLGLTLNQATGEMTTGWQ